MDVKTHPPPTARWRMRVAIGALAGPTLLLFALFFLSLAAEPGVNLEPVLRDARWVVVAWLLLSLPATAWLTLRVHRAFATLLVGVGFVALIGGLLLPATFERLNRWSANGPAVVHGSFVLGKQSSQTRTRYGWSTSYATQLADWRDPGSTIRYPGASEVERGRIVCVDERRGMFGVAWIGGLRACDNAARGLAASGPGNDGPPESDAVAGQVAGLSRLPLREVDSFELDNPVTALIGAGVPGRPFALATWFDRAGEVRWLAGAVLPLGGRHRAAGVYSSGSGRPSCPLGLAALASDNATVWSVHKSGEPSMDAIYPYEMTRIGNRLLRVWQRDDCKRLAEWRIDGWMLDADVDMQRQRVALLVVEPWASSSGVSWPEWVKAHVQVELRDWRGKRLWSRPLRDVGAPLNAKLQLAPDGLYLRDRRGARQIAGLQDGALQPLSERTPAPPPHYGWFLDATSGAHWVSDPEGLTAYAAFPDAAADPAPAPRRGFPWPLAMRDVQWQVAAVSRQGGSALVVHAELSHALLLDTTTGRWQVLEQDLRNAQASFSADGRSFAACVETTAAGRCARFARADGEAFFRP